MEEEDDFELDQEQPTEKQKEKRLLEIAEERTQLITELFSKPEKERRMQIEQRIMQLDEEYRQLSD